MKYAMINPDILRPASGSDCTNGGISSRYTKALLLIPEGMEGLHGSINILGGYQELGNTELPENTFILVRRVLSGVPYYHAKPFHSNDWFMFGGNSLDYTGNGWNTITGYPIHIHDRSE